MESPQKRKKLDRLRRMRIQINELQNELSIKDSEISTLQRAVLDNSKVSNMMKSNEILHKIIKLEKDNKELDSTNKLMAKQITNVRKCGEAFELRFSLISGLIEYFNGNCNGQWNAYNAYGHNMQVFGSFVRQLFELPFALKILSNWMVMAIQLGEILTLSCAMINILTIVINCN
jgi:hypothetical protein